MSSTRYKTLFVRQKFKVGDIEELVDDDTGDVLDAKMTKVGTTKGAKFKEKIVIVQQ